MAATDALRDKLHACISDILREEWAFSKTSHINEAANLAARTALTKVQKLNKKSQKGVRSIDFLDLPPEIRNTIYEYAVTSRNEIAVDHCTINAQKTRGWTYGTFGPPGGQPAIARASRQLRRETLKLFYSLNSFGTEVLYDGDEGNVNNTGIVDVEAVNAWLEAIGDESVQCIQEFKIRYHSVDLNSGRFTKDEIMSGKGLRKVAGVAEWVCY